MTRPRERADRLCALIEQAGGTALPFAAIRIGDPENTASRKHAQANLQHYDIAIFISPTAVEQTFKFLPSLPDAIIVGAVGSRTADALRNHEIALGFEPGGYNSEALLQQPELTAEAVAGKRIVIFRGEGGRELLADTLRERGAEVDYADMYHRYAPTDADALDDMLAQTDIITISSNQGLQNLYDLSDKDRLLALPLIVPSERTATLARALGFDKISFADNATDDAMLNALKYAVTEMSTK